MIRDFLRRKQISSKATELLSHYFSLHSSPRPQSQNPATSSRKARQKKRARNIDGFVQESRQFITEENLGIYGKARFMQTAQQFLLETDMTEADIESVLQRLVT